MCRKKPLTLTVKQFAVIVKLNRSVKNLSLKFLRRQKEQLKICNYHEDINLQKTMRQQNGQQSLRKCKFP